MTSPSAISSKAPAHLMFKNPFRKKRDFAPDTKERMRAVASSSTAGLAASLLIAPTSLMQLTPDDALIVVSYMVPRKIPAGATFITEGDQSDTGYMLLLL